MVRTWLTKSAGLKGATLELAMTQCEQGQIQSVEEFLILHNAGELAQLFPAVVIRGLVTAALKRDFLSEIPTRNCPPQSPAPQSRQLLGDGVQLPSPRRILGGVDFYMHQTNQVQHPLVYLQGSIAFLSQFLRRKSDTGEFFKYGEKADMDQNIKESLYGQIVSRETYLDSINLAQEYWSSQVESARNEIDQLNVHWREKTRAQKKPPLDVEQSAESKMYFDKGYDINFMDFANCIYAQTLLKSNLAKSADWVFTQQKFKANYVKLETKLWAGYCSPARYGGEGGKLNQEFFLIRLHSKVEFFTVKIGDDELPTATKFKEKAEDLGKSGVKVTDLD